MFGLRGGWAGRQIGERPISADTRVFEAFYLRVLHERALGFLAVDRFPVRMPGPKIFTEDQIMMRIKLLAIGLAAACALSGPALAQDSSDPAVCRDDLVKFCPTTAGKAGDVKKCLVTNKDKLTPLCKKMVETSAN